MKTIDERVLEWQEQAINRLFHRPRIGWVWLGPARMRREFARISRDPGERLVMRDVSSAGWKGSYEYRLAELLEEDVGVVVCPAGSPLGVIHFNEGADG